jgi:hypothetical protein
VALPFAGTRCVGVALGELGERSSYREASRGIPVLVHVLRHLVLQPALRIPVNFNNRERVCYCALRDDVGLFWMWTLDLRRWAQKRSDDSGLKAQGDTNDARLPDRLTHMPGRAQRPAGDGQTSRCWLNLRGSDARSGTRGPYQTLF